MENKIQTAEEKSTQTNPTSIVLSCYRGVFFKVAAVVKAEVMHGLHHHIRCGLKTGFFSFQLSVK